MEKTFEKSPQSWNETELLTRSEVALLLHSSLSYVDHLTDIPFYRIGRKKLFSRIEVMDYLKNNHINPTSKKISKTEAIRSKENCYDRK